MDASVLARQGAAGPRALACYQQALQALVTSTWKTSTAIITFPLTWLARYSPGRAERGNAGVHCRVLRGNCMLDNLLRKVAAN